MLHVFCLLCAVSCQADVFPEPFNTQELTSELSTPEAAAAAFEVPEGFRVRLFAGEPDVQQPIAMAFDSRGHLWISENDTYAEREVNFQRELNDRIPIFEDSDNDGHFDRRTCGVHMARTPPCPTSTLVSSFARSQKAIILMEWSGLKPDNKFDRKLCRGN